MLPHPDTDPLKELQAEPYRFDFVPAVRQVYRYALNRRLEEQRVGWDNFPDQEIVRFRVSSTLRHTSCQVLSVKPAENGPAYELTIPFLGLVGAQGVLPRHYSRMLLSRIKVNDYAMRDFFDLFHHRIVSCFFRASIKYRLPAVREMATMEESTEDDPITNVIRCLVGFGESSLRNRLPFSDDACLFYGGQFSRRVPTAVGLESMLGEFLGARTKIMQFQFEWLYIDSAEQTVLTAESDAILGLNTVIGDRVPSYQNRFRIQLGPLSWSEFESFLPDEDTEQGPKGESPRAPEELPPGDKAAAATPDRSDRLEQIGRFVKTYVGIGFDFDLQLTLSWDEIPKLELGKDGLGMLGWNSWVTSDTTRGLVDDAVFELT